ncbi:MAG: sugar ABC transporter ATP-binding protein [Clostridiales Family XIII bacterium]|jgi:ribose transport system ATP-binding protein|nr:sugar ABC transporter ATP-binding protein [Clostridiales Family XIII bacterium]
MTQTHELLRLADISKTFPGVRALDHIDFTLNAGEIHCICGENGAGKSTLIKIISGAYQPDDGGEIFFEGQKVALSPLGAMDLGIQCIYQEHTIFGPLSVTENIFVGMEITKGGFMQKQEMRKRTQEVLDYLSSGIDPDELTENLSSGEQKIVEFAKALIFDRKVIILDEPTASFSVTEIGNLLDIVRKIKERGIGIIYISHHLDEVEKIADRITILRDGKHINTCGADQITGKELIRQMVGRDASAFYNREHFKPGEVVLEAKGLTGNGVSDCSFRVRRGEVLGFAGMVGSGRSELMTLLFGGAQKLGGSLEIFGHEANLKSPRSAIRHKMCYITEDRQHTGLFLIHTIARNTIIANLLISSGSFYMPKKEEEIGAEYIKKLGTKAKNADVLVGNLSGGNQQKVVLAKWFNTDGEIFIFDEPTRGIDVGAKQEIYQLMTELLRDNKAIVMVSSDMPEVISMSDRVMVMKDGRIVGEVAGDEVTEANVLEYSIGGKKI